MHPPERCEVEGQRFLACAAELEGDLRAAVGPSDSLALEQRQELTHHRRERRELAKQNRYEILGRDASRAELVLDRTRAERERRAKRLDQRRIPAGRLDAARGDEALPHLRRAFKHAPLPGSPDGPGVPYVGS